MYGTTAIPFQWISSGADALYRLHAKVRSTATPNINIHVKLAILPLWRQLRFETHVAEAA